ncbi:MAG: DUF4212 domain-containing protein [Planctomycetota bacterium]
MGSFYESTSIPRFYFRRTGYASLNNDATIPEPSAVIRRAQRRYWRSNVTVMIVLLSIWAFVGLGCGVLFADILNDAGRLGGVPLGFWFAQQGSILTFVLLILVYALTMNRLDRRYHREVADAKATLNADKSAESVESTEGGDA